MRYIVSMRAPTGLLLSLFLVMSCAKHEAQTGSPTSPVPDAPTTETTVAPAAPTKAEVGQPAPDFTLTSLAGTSVSLSQHKGKIVVLEWFNPDCPFVRQSHTEGSLKGLAAKHQGEVVWLAINSNAAGKQGHSREANEAGKQRYGIDYPILLDPDGHVGHMYGAERTPHMYVIDAAGVLVYAGAIDNTSGGDVEDTPKLTNHVVDAIAALKAKEPVATSKTEAWGCTVKYAN